MAELPIEAKGVTKSFGFRAVLRGIDLEVKTGEFVALFGPNGAGKSTLLRCMSGLARPGGGSVKIFQGDPRRSAAVRRRIGLVSHAGFLHDPLTARENLMLYGRLYDVEHLRDRVAQALEEVGLSKRAHDPIRTFSRGMRQRLAIARATLHDPELLLLDEPFSGLDRAACQRLARHFDKLVSGGRTVLIVTHEFEETLAMATRAAILLGGKLVLDRAIRPEDKDEFIEEYLHRAGEAP